MRCLFVCRLTWTSLGLKVARTGHDLEGTADDLSRSTPHVENLPVLLSLCRWWSERVKSGRRRHFYSTYSGSTCDALQRSYVMWFVGGWHRRIPLKSTYSSRTHGFPFFRGYFATKSKCRRRAWVSSSRCAIKPFPLPAGTVCLVLLPTCYAQLVPSSHAQCGRQMPERERETRNPRQTD